MNPGRALPHAACAVATALFLAGCGWVPDDAAEPEQRSFSPGSDVLTIVVGDGDLEVVPADVDEIRVTRWVSGQSVLGGPRATWELSGETLSLLLECGALASCEARYEVTVPEGTSLAVENDSGETSASGFAEPLEISTENGTVSVEFVTGPLVLRSQNGDLRGSGISSPTLDASTDNGTIDVALTEAPDDVRVATRNGSATVALPEAAYDVTSSFDNGEVVTDVEEAPGSPHTIAARTENGDIRLAVAR